MRSRDLALADWMSEGKAEADFDKDWRNATRKTKQVNRFPPLLLSCLRFAIPVSHTSIRRRSLYVVTTFVARDSIRLTPRLYRMLNDNLFYSCVSRGRGRVRGLVRCGVWYGRVWCGCAEGTV